MSFVSVVNAHGFENRRAEARVWFYGERNTLILMLTRRLIDRCRWQVGDRVVFAFGVGEDHGRVTLTRVARNQAGNKLTRGAGKNTYRLSITVPPDIGGVPREDVLANLASGVCPGLSLLDGGVLMLTLPRRIALVETPNAA